MFCAMMKGFFYIGFLLFLTVSANDFNPSNKLVYSACYGSASNVFLNASCPSGTFIAPYKVYGGAKLTSTGCALEVNVHLNQSEFDRCCRPWTTIDCIAPYKNIHTAADTYVYHQSCVERRSCVGLQNARMDVGHMNCSNPASYGGNSNYLYMDYFCINEQRVGKLPKCSLETQIGDMLHVMGQTYPGEIIVQEGHCQIDTRPGATIQLWLNDLKFDCAQKILIANSTFEINCTTAERFPYEPVYNSVTNSIQLTFNNTENLKGYVWTSFLAIGSNYLKVKCENVYTIPNSPFPVQIETLPLSPEKAYHAIIIGIVAGSALTLGFVAIVIALVVKHRNGMRSKVQQKRKEETSTDPQSDQ